MKLKKIKPFLIATGSLISIFSVASLISCGTNEEKQKSQEEVKKELGDIDLTVEKSTALQGPMTNKFPRDLLDNDVVVTSSLPDGITSKIISITDRNDMEGTVTVNVELTKNNVTVQRNVTVEGFSFNPFGSDRDLNSLVRFATPVTRYAGLTQLQRFQVDNDKYIENGPLTRRQQEGETPNPNDPKPGDPDYGLLGVYKRLTATKEQLAAYDEKAALNNQDSYANSKRKGFTVPVFDDNGKVTGLQINEGEEVGKGQNWLDALANPNNDNRIPTGLARTLPSEFYKKIALQTYSLEFNNPKKNMNNFGTTWILDYQIPADGKYPTKWYFATNTHVADKLRLLEDKNYPTKAKSDDLTSSIAFTRITEATPIHATLSTTKREKTIQRWSFNPEKNPGAFRTVYQGYNFLNTSPKEYLQADSKYINAEEFADFAVIEVDFSKITLNDVLTSGMVRNIQYSTPEQLAKELTNSYADNKQDQIKFATSSYLANYKKAEWPILSNNNDRVFKRDNGRWDYDGLFAVGYPISSSDGFLDPFQDADLREEAGSYVSLWVNGRSAWYNNLGISETTNRGNFSEEELRRGNTLSYSLGYRSFKNLAGVTDLFIAAPKIGGFTKEKPDNIFKYNIDNPNGKKGSELIDSFEKDPKVSENFNNEYLYYGLNYIPRQFSPGGGASGSSIRTQDNVVVSILHAAVEGLAATSLSQAFRSEGVDYEGLYGSYNLEQYDLIYGGGKNQRTSYRQALAHLYGSETIKTNLFPQGLRDSDVPSQYRFDQKPYLKASELNK